MLKIIENISRESEQRWQWTWLSWIKKSTVPFQTDIPEGVIWNEASHLTDTWVPDIYSYILNNPQRFLSCLLQGWVHFLFLSIYMGEQCEGVLIAWNWLHKHINKREGILPENSSRTDVVALNLQETHNHWRGVLQRATSGRNVRWRTATDGACSDDCTLQEGTGKPRTVKRVEVSFLLAHRASPKKQSQQQYKTLHSNCVSCRHWTPGLCKNHC